jgi:U4/U6.U5 tri-snRNP component SNU23
MVGVRNKRIVQMKNDQLFMHLCTISLKFNKQSKNNNNDKMSSNEKKKTQTKEGVNIGTFGRRTWDREVFARKAAEREARESGGFDTDTKRKTPASTAEKKPLTASAISDGIDLEKNVGKRVAVTGETPLKSSVRRVKADSKVDTAGTFYCEVCSIVTKDSNSYLDHLNSRSHVHNMGMTRRAEKASVSSVLNRLSQAPKKKTPVVTKSKDDQEREERLLKEHAKRQMKQRKLEEAKKTLEGKDEEPDSITEDKQSDQKPTSSSTGSNNNDMMTQMGFKGFGKKN